MEEAYDEGRLADDIRTEQDKIRAADLLILQYPMSWGAMPAILHGYVQRVFSAGFAYVSNTAEIFDNSPLKVSYQYSQGHVIINSRSGYNILKVRFQLV